VCNGRGLEHTHGRYNAHPNKQGGVHADGVFLKNIATHTRTAKTSCMKPRTQYNREKWHP